MTRMQMNGVIRLIVAFVAAMLLFGAAIASAQPVTVSTGVGQTDYRGHFGMIAGWAVQNARLTEATRIRVYKGPGRGNLVWEEETRWSRSDINTLYGEGINAFHFEIPPLLCLGVPVQAIVVGVTNEGDEFSLNQGEFMVTCDPPKGVEGVVRNEIQTPLSNEGLNVQLVLFHLRDGIANPVTWTDCSNNVGCANAKGEWKFQLDSEGRKLVHGETYQVIATAQHHKYTSSEFKYDANVGIYLYLTLEVEPALLSTWMPDKFVSGQEQYIPITYCNRTVTDNVVEFHIITKGMGKNSTYMERSDVWYVFGLPKTYLGCFNFQLPVYVQADLLNGHWFNFELRAVNSFRNDEVYATTQWSAAKVATIVSLPAGDAMKAIGTESIRWDLLGGDRGQMVPAEIVIKKKEVK